MTQPPPDRQRLADALTARRAGLRLTQTALARASGVSLATINLMERRGRDNYQTLTKAMVEEAVGWVPGSIDALLAGGEATVADSDPVATSEEPAEPESSHGQADIVGTTADGRPFVAQVKEPSDELPELLEQLPAAARQLWERVATAVARELVQAGHDAVNGATISDDVLTAETDFGRTYLVTTAAAEPPKAQVERAAEQLRQALELLHPHTVRSVR